MDTTKESVSTIYVPPPEKFTVEAGSLLTALESITSHPELTQFVLSDFDKLISQHIDISRSALVSEEKSFTYSFNYVIPEWFKDLSILYRDVLLELTIAQIKFVEQSITRARLDSHLTQSKEVLSQATSEWLSEIETELAKKRTEKEIVKRVTLHKNPWPIYEKQLVVIQEQLIAIAKTEDELKATTGIFNDLKSIIEDSTEKVWSGHRRMEEATDQIVSMFESEQPKQDIIQFIEKQLAVEPEFTYSQTIFNEEVTQKINSLKASSVPVSSRDGMLLTRDTDFKRNVQLWMDYKILPSLVDLWALEDSLRYNYKLNLTNVRNGLKISQTNEAFDDILTGAKSLNLLQQEISETHSKQENLSEDIYQLISKQLLVSNIFNEDAFLEIPLQSTINLKSDSLFKKVQDRFVDVMAKFSKRYRQTHYQDSLSNIELATQCIAHRMKEKFDEQYDALFLSKNFIGDLFLTNRVFEEEKLNESIKQWKAGFNKAVLLTGERLSGKTTFITYTSKKYFGRNIVKLLPNSSATIGGRKFKTGINLEEVLNYVKANNVRQSKEIIIIEDIELWRDRRRSLLENIRALIDFVESTGNHFFVMVSTTPAMKKHLDNRMEFSKVFNSLIDVSVASKKEISNIVNLRHGASHRQLFSVDEMPISNEKVQDLIRKIGRLAGHNIGETLQTWTYHIQSKGEQKLVYLPQDYELADFFSQEEQVILKHVMIYRTISEVELKNLSEKVYASRYKSAIKRLINTKVLIRDEYQLVVNPVVLDDVLQILKRKNVL